MSGTFVTRQAGAKAGACSCLPRSTIAVGSFFSGMIFYVKRCLTLI